jgi:hypothetical protein
VKTKEEIRAFMIDAYRSNPHWRTARHALSKQGEAQARGVLVGISFASNDAFSALVFLTSFRGVFDTLKITKEDLQ